MNKHTGQIYHSPEEVLAAIKRGEDLITLSVEAKTAHIGEIRMPTPEPAFDHRPVRTMMPLDTLRASRFKKRKRSRR